jgi:long-chain acyl-CoA synthetase
MPETLIQFLNESATRFGPRTALLFKPSIRYQRWTYAQLWEQSGQVASLLQKHGLEKGDRALIWGPNCPQWVLAFFGCMRAGVILVPLDLRSAADFAERVASKTRPKLAFVSRVTPSAHGELGLTEINLEELEELCAEDGEILVRGPNITPGYWEDPEQTARAFEDGWYKTGDLGLIDAKGYLHIKGRKKDMIALADGQKVYPEDVEAVLRRHPAVADVAVVGLPKSRGVQLYAPTLVEVHAVFIMQDKAAAPDVVAWANRQLADHQRVQGFTLWRDEDFPRTHTLKVRKGAILDTLQGVAAPTTTPRSGPKADVADEPRGVRHLVAEVGGVPIAQVTSEKALGTELKLDSLGRVELLSAIEDELGVYLDETEVGPDTTVGQLQAMVEHGSHGEGARAFPRWGMSLWCRIVRGFLQRAFIFPPLWSMYRLRVSGRENLQGLDAPALFAANHTLTLDNGLIIKAMPLRWRRRLAIAASDHLWRNRLRGTGNILLGNGFPFSKAGNVRASLDNLGSILDDGWSVLIYPEGQLTIGGPMKPFLSGTGLVAVEARVPVVPLRLVVNRMGRPLNFPILRRGNVEVRFGKPLVFSPRTSYQDATRVIEEAVRAL